MLFAAVPASMLRGAEFYNNRDAPQNYSGPVQDRTDFYNNPFAPQNRTGAVNDKVSVRHSEASRTYLSRRHCHSPHPTQDVDQVNLISPAQKSVRSKRI